MLDGVNDTKEDAHRLVDLLRGTPANGNLIPFNEFPGNTFRRPTDDRVFTFQAILTRAGIDAFIRKSRGRDVLGACGQLGNVPAGRASVAFTQNESRC
mgnify:CR=1 FL=1